MILDLFFSAFGGFEKAKVVPFCPHSSNVGGHSNYLVPISKKPDLTSF